MGWHRVAELEVRNDRNAPAPNIEASLWTRGGLEGMYVEIGPYEVKITREVIESLVAYEYLHKQISRYEQMTEEELIAEVFKGAKR